MDADRAEGFVPVAEVVKAVGMKGEVKLYTLLDWYGPLLDSGYLEWGDGAVFAPESWRPSGECVVVKVAGLDGRDAAEAAVGRTVGFLRSRYAEPDFPRPDGGLPFRWLDREVRTVDGELVGTVDEVRRHGAQFTLVIPSTRGELLIPALPPILQPDPGIEGVLVIDPPKGLLDVAGD